MDLGTQVPHGAVRAYVMGERGANNAPATPEDIAQMAALVKQGVAAGALGFSTSRTIAHRAISGEPVPGTFAAEDELFGLGRALGELGRGVFELAGAGAAGEDIAAPKAELDWMRRLSAEIGRPDHVRDAPGRRGAAALARAARISPPTRCARARRSTRRSRAGRSAC